jgi:hypothetical protein
MAGDRVTPFSGQYEGHKQIALITATAKVRLELRRSAAFILYTMDSTVTWAMLPMLQRKFRDCSVIRVDGERLLPLQYLHIDESNPRRNVQTRFDWNDNKATTTLGTASETKIAEIAWPTWDPMSFQVALISLAQERRPGDGEAHRVIERGAVKHHQVRFSGVVPWGLFGRSVGIHEIVSRRDEHTLMMYLSPETAWQPVRVVIDDVVFDLVSPAHGDAPAGLSDDLTPRCSVHNAP